MGKRIESWRRQGYTEVPVKTVTVMSNSNPAVNIDEYASNPAVGHQVLSCGHERALDGFGPAGTLTLCHEAHDDTELDEPTKLILARPVPE